MTLYDGKPIFVHMTTRMRNELKEACNLEDIPLSVFVRWALREKLKTYDLGEQKRTP